MDTTEQIIEQVDDIAEAVVPEVVETVKLVKNNPLLLGAAALAGLSVGVLVGYKVAKKRLSLDFEQRLEKEIAATEEHLLMVHKYGKYATPESALHEVEAEEDEIPPEVKRRDPKENALISAEEINTSKVDYNKASKAEEGRVKIQNIFVNGQALETTFDYEAEAATRSTEAPYIITTQEFDENEPDYDQTSFSYFEGDDVLAEADTDQVVDDADGFVGQNNLQRFGHGSGDPNILFIRNDKKEMLCEIVRVQGKYTKLILGFDDSDLEDNTPLRFRNRE